MKTELNFNEFIKQQYSDWAKEAEIALKGKPISSLNTKTYEGFELKPLYTNEDLESLEYLDFAYPGFEFFLRGTDFSGYKKGSWLNIADINNIEDSTLKKFLSKSNDLCPDGISINFNFQIENQRSGNPISLNENFKNYINELDFEKTYFYFKSNFEPLQIFNIIDSVFGEMSVDKSKIKGGIEFDPVSFWLTFGKIQKNTQRVFDDMQEFVRLMKLNYPNFSAIGIDSSIFYNSGANAIQELALTLAIGNLYILEMLKRGFEVNDLASKIRVTMSAGTNFFGEIAKFRAIRVLWANLIKAYSGNAKSQKINLNVISSLINKSKLDPYVNILRITSETISAIIGGCNSLQTNSFEQIYKKADDFSFRLALNTQNVLREECNLLDVIDPAGGSYLVENLTLKYAEEAWKLFNEFVENSSFIDKLKSGDIQNMINQTSEDRFKNILIRKDILIGTNKYPNLSEENGINYRFENESNDSVPQNDMVYSKLLKIYEETEFNDIKKLIQKRLAEPFEELRLRSENFYKSTGERPKVLLACFGNLKQYKPRADFSSEYFAVGGFDSNILTFDNIDTAVSEISKSNIKVCVLCSSDDLYEALVEEFASKLKDQTNDRLLILAGNPGDKEARYSASGVDDYIYLRSNIFEKLSLIMNKIGI